jgi:hypothetical protein
MFKKRVKEQALREFGDQGADTLERYFAQIEYTAYWCIRMLHDKERIEAVIPEGVEDVVLVRPNLVELHQVKTRDESQGPWTTADALPILCQQYNRRKAYDEVCCFHFVSNQMADNKVGFRNGSFGPLYRLKQLLEIEHDAQTLSEEENSELGWFESVLIPRIIETLRDRFSDSVDEVTAKTLLHSSHIDTDSWIFRSTNNNLIELSDALSELYPGHPPVTTQELWNIYSRLLLLILGKIITGVSREARKIATEEVLNCRSTPNMVNNDYPDLEKVSGATILDKKARLGGFDPTEFPTFHRQKRWAEWVIRRLRSLGEVEQIDHLTVVLLDNQRICRDKICRQQGIKQNTGPKILSVLIPKLASIASNFFPDITDVDEQFCLGLLWRETNLCAIWWHGLLS